MADVWIGLGGNLGDRRRILLDALARLSSAGELISLSGLYETEPVGFKDQGQFLNAAACVRTELRPLEFLQALRRIEAELGRVRTVPNGPRTVDLDILFWDQDVLREDSLTIPHPRLHLRRFVLEPLCEIAPGLIHPTLGLTIEDLLAHVDDPAGVTRLPPTAEWPATPRSPAATQ